MRRLVLIAGAFLVIGLAPPGNTHGDHGKPQFGGIVKDAGSLSFELVARSDSLTVHVSEHEKPVSTAGANATLILLKGNDKSEVRLAPSGTNQLRATGTFPTGKGVTAILKVMVEGKEIALLRYSLK